MITTIGWVLFLGFVVLVAIVAIGPDLPNDWHRLSQEEEREYLRQQGLSDEEIADIMAPMKS